MRCPGLAGQDLELHCVRDICRDKASPVLAEALPYWERRARLHVEERDRSDEIANQARLVLAIAVAQPTQNRALWCLRVASMKQQEREHIVV